MILLYAVVKKSEADQVLAGQTRLIDFLSPNPETSFFDLRAEVPIPETHESAVLELTFPDEDMLQAYILSIMDAPTTYSLPADFLKGCAVRLLTEPELVQAAREIINCFIPPLSDLTFAQWIRETPEQERMERFGPYLMRAYAEMQ